MSVPKLSICPNATTFQIPTIQDVLTIAGLPPKDVQDDEAYVQALTRLHTLIANGHCFGRNLFLIAAQVADEVNSYPGEGVSSEEFRQRMRIKVAEAMFEMISFEHYNHPHMREVIRLVDRVAVRRGAAAMAAAS